MRMPRAPHTISFNISRGQNLTLKIHDSVRARGTPRSPFRRPFVDSEWLRHICRTKGLLLRHQASDVERGASLPKPTRWWGRRLWQCTLQEGLPFTLTFMVLGPWGRGCHDFRSGRRRRKICYELLAQRNFNFSGRPHWPPTGLIILRARHIYIYIYLNINKYLKEVNAFPMQCMGQRCLTIRVLYKYRATLSWYAIAAQEILHQPRTLQPLTCPRRGRHLPVRSWNT